MPENEERYQAYIAYQSHLSNRYALFSGFTFTVIAILLTQLPDVTKVQAQIALFVLTVMLWVFLHELSGAEYAIANCIRIAPPIPEAWKQSEASRLLWAIIPWMLLGLSVIILYLLWSLLYLALTSATIAAVVIIHGYITIGKPLEQLRSSEQ